MRVLRGREEQSGTYQWRGQSKTNELSSVHVETVYCVYTDLLILLRFANCPARRPLIINIAMCSLQVTMIDSSVARRLPVVVKYLTAR